jgi:hypothetical protein
LVVFVVDIGFSFSYLTSSSTFLLMAHSITLQSNVAGERVDVTTVESGSFTLGREPENTVVVESDAISRRHCCIFSAGNSWLLKDLDSSNGSWVNGVQVLPAMPRLIRGGDVIRLADYSMIVVEKADPSGQELEKSSTALLVFKGEEFQFERFIAPGDTTAVIEVDGGLQLSNSVDSGRFGITLQPAGTIELEIWEAPGDVLVNGHMVGGSLTLNDRDCVEFGEFSIIVSDLTSSVIPEQSQEAFNVSDNIGAYDRLHRPQHLLPGNDDGWESEAARRKVNANRKFVFGTAPEELDMTTAMPTINMPADQNLPISPLNRFSPARAQFAEEQANRSYHKFIVAIGALLLLIVFTWALVNLFDVTS